jgi:hypothetical protein
VLKRLVLVILGLTDAVLIGVVLLIDEVLLDEMLSDEMVVDEEAKEVSHVD